MISSVVSAITQKFLRAKDSEGPLIPQKWRRPLNTFTSQPHLPFWVDPVFLDTFYPHKIIALIVFKKPQMNNVKT